MGCSLRAVVTGKEIMKETPPNADKSTTPLHTALSLSLSFHLSFSFLSFPGRWAGESFERTRKEPAAMNEASHLTRDASMEAFEEFREGQETERSSYRLVLPADGYEWKKYGQKFIKNIGKFRSYFKCQRTGCGAKKKAEWTPTEPSDIKVKYDGKHTHESWAYSVQSEGNSTASTATNQYNLFTQVFGDQDSSIRHHDTN
ncbi:putative WRKY transcription factor 48 [Vitis vinifera]|uniref:Putative WRKY transcription factor 48 n=1 Tax=Vitis vinifera TaxID=29760 RepID=A0A438JVE8_VITVI|nr:putative WRKY transcription factor 48 [Vitis vinifera]